jgi:hypothetical protein
MMDSHKAILVIVATLIIVILFNLALYASVKRRKNIGREVTILRKAMKQAQNPWKDEQADLESLARQVAELKKGGSRENSNRDG